MALFRIERHYGAMTQEDIDAAAFRSMACLQSFPELRWIRSYFDPQTVSTHCYYETEQPDKIGEHATAAAIPCDRITELIEVTPEMWAGRDLLVLKTQ